MVTTADFSIVTLMYVWLLDWSANFKPVFDFLILYIYQTRFQDFFGYDFFDTTIKLVQMV